MRQVTFFILLSFCLSCSQSNKKNEAPVDTDSLQSIKTENSGGVQVALAFINQYIASGLSADEWVKSCGLVTESFKTVYRRIVDKAWEEDPEMGLGYDPILDAQDYPDLGFELSSYDEKEGYVYLRGKGQYKFTVVVKVVKKADKWLVDGSGRINIPEDMLEQ